MRRILSSLLVLAFTSSLPAQDPPPFFTESFDSVSPPALPSGWQAEGFSTSTSASHSEPNNVVATGNRSTKRLISPVLDFSDAFPERLVFYERRSNTARTFRLEVRASLGDTIFPLLLATFDDIQTSSSYVRREVNLTGIGLERNPSVRIRWRILPDSTNSTGVVRIDDVSIITAAANDLAVTQFSLLSDHPDQTTELSLSATVSNEGMNEAVMYSVEFFHDTNVNGRGDPPERFSIISGPPLSPADSSVVTTTHPPLPQGNHTFFAIVSFAGDEVPQNDTGRVIAHVGISQGSLVINEIMYAPAGDEPEWIELFNTLDDSLNLRTWFISDSDPDRRQIISADDFIIPPEGYGVIAKSEDFFLVHHSPSFPIVITGFPALNNGSADAVILFDEYGAVMDSVWYDPGWGGNDGRSLERIDETMPSINRFNWGVCEDSAGSTPGRLNSIARLTHDLSISAMQVRMTMGSNERIPHIDVVVLNSGREPASGYSISFYADANLNGIREREELIGQVFPPGELQSGESSQISWEYSDPPSGKIVIVAELVYNADMRTSDNVASAIVSHEYENRILVINEIMYDPLEGESEWVELYNRGSDAVDLQSWTIEDGPTPAGNINRSSLASNRFQVRPGEFIVVAADSSILSRFPNLVEAGDGNRVIILNESSGLGLGNSGDAVVLRDLTGAVIDSVFYDPDWHNPQLIDTKGRSLERINPDLDSNDERNWSTATSGPGGSPGSQNSIFTVSRPTSSSLSINPNPFSPDADGFEDFCLISYTLPAVTAVIRARLYDIRGRKIRTLADHELSASTGQILWDGKDDSGRRARIGPYVLLLEAIDTQGTLVTAEKAVVVVATKL